MNILRGVLRQTRGKVHICGIDLQCTPETANEGAAMADMNKLLRTRWEAGSYHELTAANAQTALAIILRERRKELVMHSLR